MGEEKKTIKPEVKLRIPGALDELDIPTLTSSDSGKLEFKLFCYMKIREGIVCEALNQFQDPFDQQASQLKKDLSYIMNVQDTLLYKGRILYGQCTRIAELLAAAHQISTLPQHEKSTRVIDTTEQIRHYINLILEWDASKEQLTQPISSRTSTISDVPLDQKNAYPKTLEDVLEYICSYILQQSPPLIELFISKESRPNAFELEIVDSKGNIFIHDDASLATEAVCFCENESALSQVLEKFSDSLLPEGQPIRLRIMPFSRTREINFVGHTIIVYKHKGQVRIQDQAIDAQFHEAEYQKIAESIFSARRELYITKLKYSGFLLSFGVCKPLKLVEKQSTNLPMQAVKKTVVTYPSLLDILTTQSSLTSQQRGCLLLWATRKHQFDVADRLLRESKEIDVNITGKYKLTSSLLQALNYNQPHITLQLLIRGADLNFKTEKGINALDMLLMKKVDLSLFIKHIQPENNIPDYPEKVGNRLLFALLERALTHAKNLIRLPGNSFEKMIWLTKKLLSYPGNRTIVISIFNDFIRVSNQDQLNIVRKIIESGSLDISEELEGRLGVAFSQQQEVMPPELPSQPTRRRKQVSPPSLMQTTSNFFQGDKEHITTIVTQPENRRLNIPSDFAAPTMNLNPTIYKP